MSFTFVPIECPSCGMAVLVSAENGTYDFKCECGYVDEITISD